MRAGASPENPLERVAMLAGQVPTPIFETYFAFMQARVIMAGISLGVFGALAERPDDAEGLSARLDLDPKGVDILLAALHACGYVRERGGHYENEGAVERWLLPAGETSQDAFLGQFAYDMWSHYGSLEATLRGEGPIGLHDHPADDPYWERYMRGLHDLSKLGGPILAAKLSLDSPERMLDLAGGHGGYSMALCRRHPGLHATVVELEGAARIGRAIVREEGMADRVEHRVGDLFEVEATADQDLVLAAQIAHHFEPERNVELLRVARGALKPGGTAAVVELERPPAGTAGTQVGTLTGMLFYITSNARTYTAEEVRGWFAEAGYAHVRVRRDPRLQGSMVVMGRAPSR